MKKFLTITALVAVLGLVGGYFYLQSQTPTEVATHTVRSTALKSTVNASGLLESRNQHSVFAPSTGEIVGLHVDVSREVVTDDWLVTIKKAIDDTEVLVASPITGTIFAAPATPLASGSINKNTTVSQGQLLYVIKEKYFRFLANLAEVDLAEIEVGDTATITLDAYPDSEVEGEVEFIRPEVTVSQLGEKVILVEIKILDPLPKPQLFGLSGDVSVLSEEKTGLTIPLEALATDNGSDAVYIVIDDKAIRKNVVVGDIFGDQIEILAGVSAGDVVVTDPVDEIQDGEKIKKT